MTVAIGHRSKECVTDEVDSGSVSPHSEMDVAEAMSLVSEDSIFLEAIGQFLNSVEADRFIEIPDYLNLKLKNKKWESPPLRTIEGYKYSLVVRPNGLKYTESYNKCVGIWLKPMSSDDDDDLEWPAKVRMGLTVKDFSSDGDLGSADGLTIAMAEYTWQREDTHSRYPISGFPATITHSAVEKAKCIEDGTLYILIDEEEDRSGTISMP